MKSILIDNALEAWTMAIKYCDAILEGKATLAYKKYFVSSLHNAVELFLKQRMLDINDHEVIKIEKLSEEERYRYNRTENLNQYFLDANPDEKYFSIEFKRLIKKHDTLFEKYYAQYGNESIMHEVYDAMEKLGEIRNDEMHFYIDKDVFLPEKEFELLHNFMIIFNEILQEFELLPFWGDPAHTEYSRCRFEHSKIEGFAYNKALRESNFVKELKNNMKDTCIIVETDSSAYEIAQDIAWEVYGECNEDDKFRKLWIYVEMMLQYEVLICTEIVYENQYGREERKLFVSMGEIQ